MDIANSRIPYASTLIQTEGPGAPFGLAGITEGPALPTPIDFVRGEKQWMTNGNNINDWGDN